MRTEVLAATSIWASVLPMLFFIAIHGGLRIMMGQHARSESLFYYFRIEDQVPENHLLRLLDRHIRFDFVREKLKDSYSDTGRPSIDRELLLRILLIGYLYGVTASASWSRSCRCIWLGAGLPDSASIRRFPITPRFPRTVMDVSLSPICFMNSLKPSWTVAWKPD